MEKKKRVLLINGALAGDAGNTAALLRVAASHLSARATVTSLVLSDSPGCAFEQEALSRSDALVFGTGTYWDSWGSPLQGFLERMTPTEGSSLWLGKPVAVVVTMNSVGGKGVLSRLQGVLNTFGAVIPPMSGIVYSLANHLALHGASAEQAEDLWRPDDLELVCHNLLEYSCDTKRPKSWPVDRTGYSKVWYAE